MLLNHFLLSPVVKNLFLRPVVVPVLRKPRQKSIDDMLVRRCKYPAPRSPIQIERLWSDK